jgi:hypothetical protein
LIPQTFEQKIESALRPAYSGRYITAGVTVTGYVTAQIPEGVHLVKRGAAD